MPSNTAHIQQRAQLKQHDDLVIAADEQNEWQDGQSELGLPSTPGVRSRPAPVRECAVSTIRSHFQRSDRLNKVQTQRRQRSSDSLEQQQRQPKQPKIDIEYLRQRFMKLKTSTTETAPRGIAVENTLPRFRPERVYYSGCRPFLEG
ncbi:hypothetical protein KCU98_g9866, partial [Aureobasidium melanogenum]